MKTKRSEVPVPASASVSGCHGGTRSRPPQLALRLDCATVDSGARWRDGARLPYLGDEIVLTLSTRHRDAALDGRNLHLPLPPEATPRQIQDGAEAWLRREARRVFSLSIASQARRLGRPIPTCALSFAARASWVRVEGHGELRCGWRLIEQPLTIIDQVVAAAVAALPTDAGMDDLFARAA